MDYKTIQQLESIAGSSPFYIVDRQKFEANFDGLTSVFSSRYQQFTLAYSYKTNYTPYLCNIIRQKGGWAEVVSRMEYDLALKIGQAPAKIIFNGPVKTRDDIHTALSNGSHVNLDSASQLADAADYANQHPDRATPVGLRVNIGLSDDEGLSHIQNSLKVGRFGFATEEIGSALSLIENSPLKIVSLHGHTSTTDRSQWCFEVATRTLCRIAQTYFPDTVETINVGGGFFGNMHPEMPFKNTPTFDDYAKIISAVLKNNEWAQSKKPELVIEPGVAMVADCLSFVAKVVSVKTVQENIFVTVDGSAFHAKPTFHSLNLPHEIITCDTKRPEAAYSVVGSTCMEKDYLLKDITGPLPEPGDYLRIDCVGAYTVVMSPPFITPGPAMIAKEANGFKRIRKQQTLEEIFSNYIFS